MGEETETKMKAEGYSLWARLDIIAFPLRLQVYPGIRRLPWPVCRREDPGAPWCVWTGGRSWRTFCRTLYTHKAWLPSETGDGGTAHQSERTFKAQNTAGHTHQLTTLEKNNNLIKALLQDLMLNSSQPIYKATTLVD